MQKVLCFFAWMIEIATTDKQEDKGCTIKIATTDKKKDKGIKFVR